MFCYFTPKQGKITAQGKLLLHGALLCVDQSVKAKLTDTKMEERRVFLFEQIIIFSIQEKRKNNLSQPGYIFRRSVKVRTENRPKTKAA